MAVTGTIFPKNMPMQVPHTNKRKKTSPMQHLLKKNENKQKIEMFCHIQYCVHSDISIKENRSNEVNAIRDLLQCSRSSAYR